jgi:hypothetical protein
LGTPFLTDSTILSLRSLRSIEYAFIRLPYPAQHHRNPLLESGSKKRNRSPENQKKAQKDESYGGNRRKPGEAERRCPKGAARNARGEASSTTHQHGVRQVVSKKREAPSIQGGVSSRSAQDRPQIRRRDGRRARPPG